MDTFVMYFALASVLVGLAVTTLSVGRKNYFDDDEWDNNQHTEQGV